MVWNKNYGEIKELENVIEIVYFYRTQFSHQQQQQQHPLSHRVRRNCSNANESASYNTPFIVGTFLRIAGYTRPAGGNPSILAAA